MNCNICGKEVTKRKSLAFKDGRACRDHEEIIKIQEEQKKILENKIHENEEKENGK